MVVFNEAKPFLFTESVEISSVNRVCVGFHAG
jgi:hypothetical protein